MEDDEAYAELGRLASRLGIEVRSRVLRGAPGSGSGLCRLRGNWVVIINSHSTLHEKRAALAEALATVQAKNDPPSKPGLAGLGPRGRRRGGA